jgi:hypothetical protein
MFLLDLQAGIIAGETPHETTVRCERAPRKIQMRDRGFLEQTIGLGGR